MLSQINQVSTVYIVPENGTAAILVAEMSSIVEVAVFGNFQRLTVRLVGVVEDAVSSAVRMEPS